MITSQMLGGKAFQIDNGEKKSFFSRGIKFLWLELRFHCLHSNEKNEPTLKKILAVTNNKWKLWKTRLFNWLFNPAFSHPFIW